jgi:hypothetical protein
MIFEDDARLTPSAVKNIQAIFNEDLAAWPDSYRNRYPDMINLNCSVMCRYKKVTPRLYLPYVVNGTSAYLISIKGLSKCVEVLDKAIGTHVDFTLFYKNLLNDQYVNYYATDNYLKNEDDFGSSISSRAFPKVESEILNRLLMLVSKDNHVHIVYDSVIFGNDKISFSILVVGFILVVAMLIRYEMYDVACAYVAGEVIYWYWKVVGNKGGKC